LWALTPLHVSHRVNEDSHGKLEARQGSNECGAYCAIICAFCANDYPVSLIESAVSKRRSDTMR